MRKELWRAVVLAAVFIASAAAPAQTVSVKFRYVPDAVYPRVHFPGQFNNWGPNASGTIASGAVSQADSFETATGMWVKTIPLAFGTYQYKIYRQKSLSASDWSWIPDPLNRVVIQPDQNSQIVVDSLVLFQLMASPFTIESGKFVVKSAQPSLTAGIFRPAGAPAPALSVWVDGAAVPDPSSYYDPSQGIFTYKPAPLADGIHVLKISASAGTLTKTDSVSFETRGRAVQIQSPSFTTRKNVFVTAGIVLATLDSVTISVNGAARKIAVKSGAFTDSTQLAEGRNVIRVEGGAAADSIVVTRVVNHAPYARASVAFSSGSDITLSASATTDPDGDLDHIAYTWKDDPAAPLGLNGKTGVTATIAKPKTPGEYYFTLVAADTSGNADTTRAYFIINANGSYANPAYASNPSWAKQARVYFMFPKGITKEGTLNAAALKLQYVRDMGFNVVWLMPVMKNAYPIDNNIGPGYNIVDFYHVAPEYGTDQDFKNFMAKAHALGLKVILDVTPNHSSRFHPWSQDAHANKTRSPYWNWYQHQAIAHNTNGLGQSADADGFYYYSGFSDQLLNLNWTDIDMQSEMINVYKYWIKEFGLDGYRFDVYWGPHRKYGEQYMGHPVREALKHIKPDILLLGEDDGTGSGTETIYADVVTNGVAGGLDAAYDFKLFFNQIRGFGFNSPAVENLNNEILNGNFYPGPNALYMRFMESQDEDAITYQYSAGGFFDNQTTFHRTMPMASVIFTVPGFPMVWNGQEIGYGLGIGGSKENRVRSVINWDYEGRTVLMPHYQRLAWIRGAYPAFATHSMIPLGTSNGLVYGYSRPYENENAIVLENFGNVPLSASVPLVGAGDSPNVYFTGGVADNKTYYLNDVYNDSSSSITFSGGSAVLNVTLPGYGTAIYILSDSLEHLTVPVITSAPHAGTSVPARFALEQNYPNPFNPSTTIRFSIPSTGRVSLRVFDVLGREVGVLADSYMHAGSYSLQWNAAGMPSGMYMYELRTGSSTIVKRMMVIK